MDDKTIKQTALKNRDEAFKMLFDLYFDRITRYCLHLTGEPDESFDIAQEVLIKASLEEALYSDGFQIRAWLYRVARNACLSYFRELKKKFRFLNMYRVEESNSETIERNLEYERINRLLSKIPPKFRNVLYLRFYEDMSYEEIAEVEKIPVGSVKSRLSFAKEYLAEVLKNEQ
ncbi:MAG: RNA polymerase sigma factor [Candidatus Wallbacteria bacterium]|nr:RNA polymerase sigma factor [Candidatus Wallbacteria bacterium]